MQSVSLPDGLSLIIGVVSPFLSAILRSERWSPFQKMVFHKMTLLFFTVGSSVLDGSIQKGDISRVLWGGIVAGVLEPSMRNNILVWLSTWTTQLYDKLAEKLKPQAEEFVSLDGTNKNKISRQQLEAILQVLNSEDGKKLMEAGKIVANSGISINTIKKQEDTAL